MELVVQRVETAELSRIGILLDSNGPVLIQVIRDARCRHEFEVTETTVIVGVHNWIEDDVHRFQMQTDNGPYLGGNPPGFPILVIDAELEIDAVKESVVGRMRPHEQLAQFESVE